MLEDFDQGLIGFGLNGIARKWVATTRQASHVRSAVYRGTDRLDALLSDDADSALLHDVLPAKEEEDDEDRSERTRVTQLALIGLPRREQRIAGMLLDGYRQAEIASVLGVSEAAISIALRRYRLRVALLAVKALKAQAPENAAVDTRLSVQWVTM